MSPPQKGLCNSYSFIPFKCQHNTYYMRTFFFIAFVPPLGIRQAALAVLAGSILSAQRTARPTAYSRRSISIKRMHFVRAHSRPSRAQPSPPPPAPSLDAARGRRASPPPCPPHHASAAYLSASSSTSCTLPVLTRMRPVYIYSIQWYLNLRRSDAMGTCKVKRGLESTTRPAGSRSSDSRHPRIPWGRASQFVRARVWPH